MSKPLLEIRVREVVQAGDVFLMHINCPRCRRGMFGAYPVIGCGDCGMTFEAAVYTLPTHRKFFRLLAGTRRKSLRYQKRTIATLLEIQDRSCAYCDVPFLDTEYEIDHVLPITAGGTNLMRNLALACSPCNQAASNRVFPDFLAKRLWLAEKARHRKRPGMAATLAEAEAESLAAEILDHGPIIEPSEQRLH